MSSVDSINRAFVFHLVVSIAITPPPYRLLIRFTRQWYNIKLLRRNLGVVQRKHRSFIIATDLSDFSISFSIRNIDCNVISLNVN